MPRLTAALRSVLRRQAALTSAPMPQAARRAIRRSFAPSLVTTPRSPIAVRRRIPGDLQKSGNSSASSERVSYRESTVFHQAAANLRSMSRKGRGEYRIGSTQLFSRTPWTTGGNDSAIRTFVQQSTEQEVARSLFLSVGS